MRVSTPLKIAIKYAIIGVLWIFVSDYLVRIFHITTISFIDAQTLKGTLFVLVSAGVIYILVKNDFEKVDSYKRKHQTLLSNLPGMAYRCRNTLEWPMEYVSLGCDQLTGYTSDDIVSGRPVHYGDLIHQDDKSATWDEVQRCIKNNRPFILEYRIHTKDGTEKWVWEQGQHVGTDERGLEILEGFITDVTDRKLAEKALEDSNRSLRTILDSIPADIYVSDMETDEILFMNARMRESFGRDCVGEICWRAFRGAKGPCAHCTNSALLDDQGRPTGVQVWEGLNPVNGIWYLNYDQAIPWIDGRYVRIQIATDISDRKSSELALVQARDLAEAANRTKSEFLANMSHEIRTPLNGIMGMLQLLQMSELNEEQLEYVNMGLASTDRLSRLLSDVLDISKIEAGKLDIRSEPFEMQPILQSIEDIFAQTVKANRNRLQLHVADNVPPRLVGDSARLSQILFNLVGNAVKYTLEGQVDVSVSRLPLNGPNGCRLLFEVSDTGPGIEDHKLDTIFETFSQASEASTPYTREYEGAGLGLALVKRLVNLMDGSGCIVSETGRGTAFSVSLPFRLPQPSQADSSSLSKDGPERELSGRRILVAEDDPTTQASIQSLLQRQGSEVSLAENGEEVLTRLQEADFDCILMDVQMPVLDGVETTRRIRASGDRNARVPILGLSAYAMSGDREKFLAAGMDDYLPKPVNHKKLLELLGEHTREG